MDNQILLSICFPTYNQSQDLKRTLSSIIPQIIPGKVELIVADNSTNLETERIVKKYFDLPYLHYFRHGTNLGVDRNIIFLTEEAKGKYIWLFGDDQMQPGAINYILNTIKKYPSLALIWVNYKSPGRNYPRVISPKDQIFKDGSQALDKIGIYINFISSLIFLREKLSNIDKKNRDSFMGSGLINLYLPLSILSQEGKFYIVSYPYVINSSTPREAYRYDYFQFFGIKFFSVVKNFQSKFQKKTYKKLIKQAFYWAWKDIFVGWIKGYNTPKGKFSPLLKIYWNLPEFWLIVPLFLMPRFVIKIIYFIYRKIIKPLKLSVKNCCAKT